VSRGSIVSPAPTSSATHEKEALRELVVCSLEAWDEVWRRNQFFVSILMRRIPTLRVLFVEPAADILFDLSQRRLPERPRFGALDGRRLRAFRPLKPLPRRMGSLSDRLLLRQVTHAARLLRFRKPVLWLNDVTYAPLIQSTGWPTVYDVTDDWLVAPSPPRELERLRALEQTALERAEEVVVCSPALAASRGRERSVALVPNAVDADHFQLPRPRPGDLPASPVAVYVGSLHEARIDVDLVVDVARALPSLTVALIGPDSFESGTRCRLRAEPNIRLLGPRPYGDIPAYLQHADVVVVPHRLTPFTESLDPIKAYECLAVGAPTVATPVSGFRDVGGAVTVAPRESFAAAVGSTLAANAVRPPACIPASWEDRAREFERVLLRAQHGRE
jgi:glycosyltransferase involved in cell wall biosynthesis